MHKYLPRVCIVEESSGAMGESPSRVFCFHETAFIAVTAYQNEKVSIDNMKGACACVQLVLGHTFACIHSPYVYQITMYMWACDT